MKDQIEEMKKDLKEIFDEEYEKRRLITPDFTAEKMTAKGYSKQIEGEWVDQYQGMYANQLYKCSVCGETAFHDDKRWFLTNFCPNCGAKMKGGAE